jgi:hypothetical protein
MGQTFFLNRWIFRDRGPGFFVDVGAFDGELGSNTWFFEKRLGWSGIAFEPNGPEYESLRRTRTCRTIQGCAYNRNGEVSFLALSEKAGRSRTSELFRPANLTSLALDPRHGAVMLSGIREHIENMDRVENLRAARNLEQKLVTVPCYRIDTVLEEAGANGRLSLNRRRGRRASGAGGNRLCESARECDRRGVEPMLPRCTNC